MEENTKFDESGNAFRRKEHGHVLPTDDGFRLRIASSAKRTSISEELIDAVSSRSFRAFACGTEVLTRTRHKGVKVHICQDIPTTRSCMSIWVCNSRLHELAFIGLRLLFYWTAPIPGCILRSRCWLSVRLMKDYVRASVRCHSVKSRDPSETAVLHHVSENRFQYQTSRGQSVMAA